MSIYRFSARDSTELPDIQVSDHDSLDDARREALRVAERLMGVAAVEPHQDWMIDVADERGMTLFSLTLSFNDAPALSSSFR